MKQLVNDRRYPTAVFALAMLLGGVSGIQPAAADGWHNPVLELGSIDDWLQDAKAAVPDLDEQLGSSSLRAGRGIEDLKKLAEGRRNEKQADAPKAKQKQPVRGGNLQAKLTPQQEALLARQANDCMQVLAFMKEGNIIPREFPKFPIAKMAEYRQTAKQLLGLMGPSGKQAVLGTLQNHLMAGFQSQSDVDFHPDYVDDLLQVLGDAAANGTLTPAELDDLERAMQGAKPPPVRDLVKAIDKTLSETLAFKTIVERLTVTSDPKRKAQMLQQLQRRIGSASPDELQEAIVSDELYGKTKAAIVRELKKSLPELGIVGLLKLLLVEHPDLQLAVDGELRSRRATYANLKGELFEIWQFADSPDKRVAGYAQYFTAKAFGDAPIGHCLYWLGQGDDRLAAVIWKQLDARISKADAQQKAEFAATVFKALEAKDLTLQNRKDCLELLGRIKHRESAKQLVDLLLPMERELWPSAGQALESITGQDYGPKPGDGVAEVTGVVRRWRDWLKQNGL